MYSCTSNGALRLTMLSSEPTYDGDSPVSHLATLPMRLCDWQLSENGNTFVYGGDEVELSMWDAERAFVSEPPRDSATAETKKRKRGNDLLPAEVWRAKNVRSPHTLSAVSFTCLNYR